LLSVDAANFDNLLATALSLSTTQSSDVSSKTNNISRVFNSPVTSYVCVYRDGFSGRGNTLASYGELNRYVSVYVGFM
jgi:translation initiation factor eIF-2B subunit gamma